MDAATLEREALRLPAADRALLADRLLQSLDRESVEQLGIMSKEAEKRLVAYDQGSIATVKGPAAVTELRLVPDTSWRG